MIDPRLAEIAGRVRKLDGVEFCVDEADGDHPTAIRVTAGGISSALQVKREGVPAGDHDTLFVGHAVDDLRRLLAHLEGTSRLTAAEIAGIGQRVEGASPGPWTPFLERDGGLGGCSFIQVPGSDFEPDLYLWLGDQLVPDDYFDVIGFARQDIPFLLAHIRH